MWPVIYTALRTYAPYVTLPVAALVGVIGYNLESWISNRYTPYNKSIKEQREDRLLVEAKLKESDKVEKLKYKANILDTNLSPSLT
ncbi:small integral membrane protein 12 isoform X2 [Diabrotica virgifera virgifera]|nr:small integral membrane protein 12 isoform X2 [Diabrotica virgifera virgifera]XP_050505713.1 small integral membrane protein 12 isoform X2 [Diabrotica virgifera virgifera]